MKGNKELKNPITISIRSCEVSIEDKLNFGEKQRKVTQMKVQPHYGDIQLYWEEVDQE